MSEQDGVPAESVALVEAVQARIDRLEARVAELEGAVRQHMADHDELWIPSMHIDRLLWQHVEPDGLTQRERADAERHTRWEDMKKQRDEGLLGGGR